MPFLTKSSGNASTSPQAREIHRAGPYPQFDPHRRPETEKAVKEIEFLQPSLLMHVAYERNAGRSQETPRWDT